MARSDATTITCRVISPSAFAINRIAAPIAPGPAMSGVAIGKIEISCFDIASCSSSSVVEVPPDERANTISMPISNSKIPPAVLNAASDIPRLAKRSSPIRAKTTRITAAINVARIAIDRLCLIVPVAVSAANTAATSIGPIVAKKVAKAKLAVSIIQLSLKYFHLTFFFC